MENMKKILGERTDPRSSYEYKCIQIIILDGE